MNRIIKFRVWDKQNLKWLSFNKYWCFTIFDEPHLICQQYTGIKDKNTKEIYEGDIIELENAPYKYEIVWDIWKWGIDSKGIVFEGIQGLTSAIYDRAIVIGNIFEAPELLNSIQIVEDIDDEDIDEDLDLEDCEQCGGNPSWDGYICHNCGMKNI